MIQHIVIAKFAQEATDEQKTELIKKSMKLKDEIPGIIDIQQGFNLSERSQGYEYGVTIRFEDKKALDRFSSHPKHLEVGVYLKELGLEDIIVVDFEI